MADEGGWLVEDDTSAPQTDAPAAATGDGAAPPPAESEAPREEMEPEAPRDPNRLILFKHWTRPKFLQYNYMYDYRHNYYDDVIDYLDKRQRGYRRDIPHPQTWAERALRTYSGGAKTDALMQKDRDAALVSEMKTSGHFFRYHTKAYIQRRYSSYLYR